MTSELLSVGDIARAASVPIHRVQYVIRSRKIAAAALVGGYQVFTPAQAEQIKSVLDEINSKRRASA